MKHLAWVFVHGDLRHVANFDVGELRLAIIRLHPLNFADEGNYLRTRRDQLSRPHLPFPHRAIAGRLDRRIAQVYLCIGERSLLAVEIGHQLPVLRFQDGLGPAFGLRRQLIAAQLSFCLFQISLTARERRRKPFLVGHCLFNFLLRG